MHQKARPLRSIQLAPIADISRYQAKFHQTAFNVGYDGLLYFVFAHRTFEDYQKISGALFPTPRPSHAQRYSVVALDENRVAAEIIIDNEPFNIHYVAPVPEGVLLACARSHFYDANNYEKNGRLYSFDGIFQSDLLLGDGINDLQTTADGTIWTSYFDEGIFGNYGWGKPVGVSGLVAWNLNGEKIYEFEPTGTLDQMCDCYALNVMSAKNVWCYYYTEFPLVQIQDGRTKAYWEVPVGGSNAFAIGHGYAFFRGGYSEPDNYILLQLKPDKAVEVGRFEILSSDAGIIKAERVVGWRDALYLQEENRIYRLDIPSAVGQL